MEKKIEFSKYQTAVFQAVRESKSNIIVNAVAGSGKTFTIVECCKQLNLRENEVRFLAFNKSIATELGEKLAGVATVSTLHSFGFEVLKKVYGRRIKVNAYKYNDTLKENIYSLSSHITVDSEKSQVYLFIKNTLRLFDLCRVNLIQHGCLGQIEDVAIQHSIRCDYDEIEVVNELLKQAYKMPKSLCIDFIDMVVLPTIAPICNSIPTYKFVFVDECQDLNNAQRLLMLHAARKGRFVAVGDRRQAINGFAGADCNSFDKIANIDNTVELPLSVNYRCGKKMIEMAKEIVPTIEAHAGAINGKITSVDTPTLDLFKSNDMVISRKTAPLVVICLKLIKNGVTAIIKGSDIGEDLIRLSAKIKSNTLEGLHNNIEAELEKCCKVLISTLGMKKEDAMQTKRYMALKDRLECIAYIAAENGLTGIEEKIAAMFSDKAVRNGVLLSTIHKAKGLESDRVVLLSPQSLPMTWENQAEWQYQQEVNLKYVAITRAKKELVLLNCTNFSKM